MARRLRYSIPGATFHVMLRGNNGQSIFSSEAERCRFCLLLQEGVERYGHRILAFCFMTNHVHLALQLNEVPLSKICQNLAFRYTRFYNRRHKTIGHLFQGRFKSILVDGNRYLKELIRYIHLNPVRAGIVQDPLDYHWSSHQAYLMKQEYTWLSSDDGLQIFGKSRQEAMKVYHHFVLSGIALDDGIDFKKGTLEGILGDDLFVEKMQGKIENAARNKSLTIDLKKLISFVTDWYGIDGLALQKPGIERKAAHVRAMSALLARGSEGVSLRELADFYGRSDSSMSQAAGRLEARMPTFIDLKNEFDALKTSLISAAETGKVCVQLNSNVCHQD